MAVPILVMLNTTATMAGFTYSCHSMPQYIVICMMDLSILVVLDMTATTAGFTCRSLCASVHFHLHDGCADPGNAGHLSSHGGFHLFLSLCASVRFHLHDGCADSGNAGHLSSHGRLHLEQLTSLCASVPFHLHVHTSNMSSRICMWRSVESNMLLCKVSLAQAAERLKRAAIALGCKLCNLGLDSNNVVTHLSNVRGNGKSPWRDLGTAISICIGINH